MRKCWCGETHTRGSIQNGEVKHVVLNWQLYWLRHKERRRRRSLSWSR